MEEEGAAKIQREKAKGARESDRRNGFPNSANWQLYPSTNQ